MYTKKNCGVCFWTCWREISGDRVALFLCRLLSKTGLSKTGLTRNESICTPDFFTLLNPHFCSEFASKMERRGMPNHSNKTPRTTLGRSLSNNDLAQEEKNDGSISDSAVTTTVTEGHKRRPSLGYKVAALVGLSRKSSSTSQLTATNKKAG